jgi:hypothetical protein
MFDGRSSYGGPVSVDIEGPGTGDWETGIGWMPSRSALDSPRR